MRRLIVAVAIGTVMSNRVAQGHMPVAFHIEGGTHRHFGLPSDRRIAQNVLVRKPHCIEVLCFVADDLRQILPHYVSELHINMLRRAKQQRGANFRIEPCSIEWIASRIGYKIIADSEVPSPGLAVVSDSQGDCKAVPGTVSGTVTWRGYHGIDVGPQVSFFSIGANDDLLIAIAPQQYGDPGIDADCNQRKQRYEIFRFVTEISFLAAIAAAGFFFGFPPRNRYGFAMTFGACIRVTLATVVLGH